jgi:hypothetical protein
MLSRVNILIKLLRPIKRGGDRRFHLNRERPRELMRGTGMKATKIIKAGRIKRAITFLSLSIFSITPSAKDTTNLTAKANKAKTEG